MSLVSMDQFTPLKAKESRGDMSPLIELRYYVNLNVPW